MDLRDTSCCAMVELTYIDGAEPEKVLEEILRKHHNVNTPDFRFIMFTQAMSGKRNNSGIEHNTNPYGDKLMAYIHKHKLGEVTRSSRGINPNTGNSVTVFVWRLSDTGLKAYKKAHNIKSTNSYWD